LIAAIVLAAFLAQGQPANVKDFGAAGDGKTDDLPAIEKALASIRGKNQRLLFPAGTYGVSGTVIIPTETQIEGVGRGDPGGSNTVIQALPSFPVGGTVVQMGNAPGPNYGVHVQNMTIHGSSRAGVCLDNSYSEEQSIGRDLLLSSCDTGLRVATGAAQNSGPFENLEILAASDHSTNTKTVCVEVRSVPAFRGIHGMTCNAGSRYGSRPAVAMAIDGTGTYQDIHVEHFATAVALGSRTNSADSLIFADGEFGPDVTTGIDITAAHGVNNQNLTILGISCAGCTTLLKDEMTGTKIAGDTLGWYLLGNGAGADKAIWSSNHGVPGQISGRLRAPEVQLTSSGPQPACSSSARGTLWFERGAGSGTDHLQICRKTATGAYAWTNIF